MRRNPRHLLLPAVFAVACLLIPLSGQYATQVFVLALINATLTMSHAFCVEVAGVTSLGHAGFMAIGAYTAAVLNTGAGVNFLLTFPAAALLAGIAGVFVAAPSLRVRDLYYMMVTLAFGAIVRLVALNWESLTRGPLGIVGVEPLSLAGQDFSATGYFFAALLMATITYAGCQWLYSSAFGLVSRSSRDDSVAAQSLGMNVLVLRVIAAGIGSAFAGLAGAFYAHMYSYVSPTPFSEGLSLTIVAMSLLGDIVTSLMRKARFMGPVIAAVLLTWLSEGLRGTKSYRMALFGLTMLAVMALRPQIERALAKFTGEIAAPERRQDHA